MLFDLSQSVSQSMSQSVSLSVSEMGESSVSVGCCWTKTFISFLLFSPCNYVGGGKISSFSNSNQMLEKTKRTNKRGKDPITCGAWVTLEGNQFNDLFRTLSFDILKAKLIKDPVILRNKDIYLQCSPGPTSTNNYCSSCSGANLIT